LNEIITHNQQLPDNIQEIMQEVLIGREKLNAIRAAINAAKKLNKPTYEAMRAEGREYGERILDYELMLKEYFENINKGSGGDRGNQYTGGKSIIGDTFAMPTKQQTYEELGFTKNEVIRIQQLTAEAVAEAKEYARENNDIPTRSLALKIAQQNKKQAEQQQKITEQLKTSQVSQSIDIYNTDKKYRIIYADPPYPYEFIECWRL